MEKQYSKKSFTIIELIVVISIIIIISGIVLVNYGAGQKQLNLQRSTSKLAQDIRRVQEMTMSAKECTHPTVCPAGGVPPGGYGIYFNKDVKDSYIIYADISSPNEQRNPGGEEDIETISLGKEVEIDSVTPPKASINFKPPDPIVRLKNEAGINQSNVTIILRADSNTKTIQVNKVGRIDID